MKAENTFKTIIQLLKNTFISFNEDRALKFCASLSYYTIFSLAPLLLLAISLAGFFFGRDAIKGKLFGEINGLIGKDAAIQIENLIKNIELSGGTNIAVIVSGITLLIGATTIFVEIQDSINFIWNVKAKPKKGWLKLLKDRLLSYSLIVVLGFLLIVSLIVNGALVALSDWLKNYFPDVTITLFGIINVLVSFIVITTLFGVIFKVLPDAKVSWKHVRIGAFFTACLFMIGRFLIGYYIYSTSTGSAYGAAASVIVILVWVYYSAAILYFGAEFTKVYVEHIGAKIEPADFAVYVERTEIEKEAETAPENIS